MRAFLLILSIMKTCILFGRNRVPSRLAASSLALAAAFPSVALSQTYATLKDVVVTATRFSESSASLPFGVSVITSEDISAFGITSINEAVMKLLGVPGRLDTSGGNNYTLDLRGFGVTADSNQVVIVDGLRMNEGDTVPAGLAHIPIDSVERIEVLRGTGSVLYGEGATGGVIVVTTKAGAGVKRINSAQLYGAAGSNGLSDIRANAVLASGGFSMDVSADDRRSDGHRENLASTSKDLAVSAQWSNDWLRVGARGGHNELQSGLPGSLSTAAYLANPYQADPSRITAKTDMGNIKSDNSGVFFEASVGDWQWVADANQRAKKYVSVMYGGAYGYDVNANNYSARARHESRLDSGSNVFVAGSDKGDWKRTITASGFTPVGTVANANTVAYYLKDDFTFASTSTRLSAGWRTEEMKKFEGASVTAMSETQNAWEFGVSQPLTEKLMVYGRMGSSFRLANVDEFSFTTPGATLKPQTSRDLELGARWKLASTELEARWYRNELNNEIIYDSAAMGPYSIWGSNGANVNLDPTQRQGIELEMKQAIDAGLDLRFNAALRQATFTTGAYSGNTVPLVPSKTLAFHANWRPASGHSLDGGLNWVSSQYAGGDFLNQFSMPAYTTLDVRYAYQLRNVEFALSVSNLLDEKYYSQAYVNFNSTDVGIYPEPGRTFTASVRLKF